MGSAVTVALSKLPDELDLATTQRILGERFDQAVFDRLKDTDGFLRKEDLLVAVQEMETAKAAPAALPPEVVEVEGSHDVDAGLTEPQRIAEQARAVAEKARDLWMVRSAPGGHSHHP